jgi:hypothetical protein
VVRMADRTSGGEAGVGESAGDLVRPSLEPSLEFPQVSAPVAPPVQPVANGVAILIADLPACVDSHWAERDGRRWLVIRGSLTVRAARELIAMTLTGQADSLFHTTMPDPGRPGRSLLLTTAELPGCTDVFHGERRGSRFILVNRSLTTTRAQRLVAEFLGGARLRPQATIAGGV